MTDDPESALRAELRRLGKTTADEFTIPYNGVNVRVVIVTGSSSYISFTVPYDEAARGHSNRDYRGPAKLTAIRPMRIELLVETEVHESRKAEGTDVEHQTGDPTFDQKVYIDTPTKSEVLVHVLNADVREAALELFAFKMSSITIDSLVWKVHASMNSFSNVSAQDPPAAALLDAFTRLARSLPPVERAVGERHPTDPLGGWTVLLGVAAAILFCVSWPFYFGVTAEKLCTDDMTVGRAATCGLFGIAGVIVGGAIAGLVVLALRPRLKLRFSGTSSSGQRISTFLTCLFFFLASLTGSLAAFALSRLVAL